MPLTEDQKFKYWIDKVDTEVEKRVCMSVHDLPDCPYRDWFEDGVSPVSAARKAIKNAKE